MGDAGGEGGEPVHALFGHGELVLVGRVGAVVFFLEALEWEVQPVTVGNTAAGVVASEVDEDKSRFAKRSLDGLRARSSAIVEDSFPDGSSKGQEVFLASATVRG